MTLEIAVALVLVAATTTIPYVMHRSRRRAQAAAKPATPPVARATRQNRLLRARAAPLQRLGRTPQADRQPSLIDAGEELGSGGQGRIYEVAGDPHRVLKSFLSPIAHGVDDFRPVLASGEAIAAELIRSPIMLCWPDRAIVDGDALLGYVMPRIDPAFYFTMQAGLTTKHRLCELQYAVPRTSVFKLPFAATDQNLLDLVRLVAEFLAAMHRHDLIYGDISWVNFSFALAPVRLCVLDFDSTRHLGAPAFIGQRPVDTIDWNDPSADRAPVSTLDAERYKFALLAYRLLVAHDLDSRIDPDRVMSIGGLPRLGDLQHLWRRAAGPGGTRPQLSEWVRALAP